MIESYRFTSEDGNSEWHTSEPEPMRPQEPDEDLSDYHNDR